MICKNFIIGCNYWASDSGTEMWNLWDEKNIEQDFRKLKEYRIEYLRVFPNWRDFQPVHPLIYAGGWVRDYRLHDAELPKNPYYEVVKGSLEQIDPFELTIVKIG